MLRTSLSGALGLGVRALRYLQDQLNRVPAGFVWFSDVISPAASVTPNNDLRTLLTTVAQLPSCA